MQRVQSLMPGGSYLQVPPFWLAHKVHAAAQGNVQASTRWGANLHTQQAQACAFSYQVLCGSLTPCCTIVFKLKSPKKASKQSLLETFWDTWRNKTWWWKPAQIYQGQISPDKHHWCLGCDSLLYKQRRAEDIVHLALVRPSGCSLTIHL